MKKLIVFTDLDGTLLDLHTYSFEKALPGLVPDRFLKLNIKAFEKGYMHGLEVTKPDTAEVAAA